MITDKILITGATGFLGKHIASFLSSKGESIFLTANHEDKEIKVQRIDLTDFVQIKRKIKEIKPTVVYHLGALVNLTRDFEIGKNCIETNLIGTFNLLESLRELPPQKFIFASTEEVYGEGVTPYREGQICFPPSPYAISKLAGENLCSIYAKELGFSLFNLRIGTMYGPENPESRFIPQIIKKAIRNEDIPLNLGTKKRDYVYVEDVVNALVLAKDVRIKSQQETINVGGGISYKLIDVANLILSLVKSRSKLLLGKLPERINEADEWLLDISKAKKILNWKPRTSLKDGLEKTIEYYNLNLV